MNWVLLSSLLVLGLSSYLTALILSIHRKRRGALAKRFEAQGRPNAAAWIMDHREAIIMILSFVRTTARLTFFALVLVEIVGVGPDSTLTIEKILIAGAISIGVLWLFSTVLALAIAEHAGVGLIAISYLVLRAAGLVGRPLARSLSFIDEGIRRLSGATMDAEEVEDELLQSIEESQLEGEIDPGAAEMLENVVEFRSAEVSEVMTPRTDIEGIELIDDLRAIRAFIMNAGHSRIPVFRTNLDQIAGILYVKDLIPYLGTDAPDFRLEPILRKPIVVPETKPVPELLRDFQRSEVHMAIVIDEYGGTAGLVTIEDILEEIVGEIHDEHEPPREDEPALISIDDSRAEVDGRYHIDELNEHLGLDLPEDEDYETVAGFMMAKLGRVPEVGDSLETRGARFTTLAATETHVKRIGVELLRSVTPNGSEPNGK